MALRVKRGNKRQVLAAAAAAGAAYLAGYYLAPRLPAIFLPASVFWQPLIWTAAALGLRRFFPIRAALRGRSRLRVMEMALATGVLTVVLFLFLGLVEGFARSPFAFTPTGIASNLYYSALLLLAGEMCRALMVSSVGRRPLAGVVGVALLFTFFSFSPARYSFPSFNEGVRFFTAEFFPTLAENIFATAAAYLGGWQPAVLYRGVLTAFQWFSPLLPNLSWGTKAFAATVVPALATMVLAGLAASSRRREEGSMWAWLVTAALSTAIIWFSLGLFPIFPSVIISGSMRPYFQVGDIALVYKVKPETLRVGDVVCYRGESLPVLHRIIEIREERGERLLVTKGDANRVPDPAPVAMEQVKGKVVGKIPKIGWFTVFLRTKWEPGR